jgi:hypothetical protein
MGFSVVSYFCLMLYLGRIMAQLTHSLIPLRPFTGISLVTPTLSPLSFMFYSGLTSDGTYFPGLQTCTQVRSEEWSCSENIQNYSPDPRRSYASFIYGYDYYIFGGVGPYGTYNDIWTYNWQYAFWSELDFDAKIPARHTFAYTMFSYDFISYFAVYGGISNTNSELNDFYL